MNREGKTTSQNITVAQKDLMKLRQIPHSYYGTRSGCWSGGGGGRVSKGLKHERERREKGKIKNCSTIGKRHLSSMTVG